MVKNKNKIRGGMLPAVLVISLLMLLGVWGAFILFDGENLFLWKMQYNRQQWANLESACLLYKNDTLFMSRLEQDSSLVLYADKPASKIYASVSLWGLYEKLTVKGEQKRPVSHRLLGNAFPFKYKCSLYYPDRGNSLCLTGNTTLKGNLSVPLNGLRTGQMKWEFFSGEQIDLRFLLRSDPGIPAPLAPVRKYTDSLLQLVRDAWETTKLETGAGIITGGRIVLDESGVIPPDVLVIGRTIVIEEGTSCSAQFFATDSIILKEGVTLQYPSGLFVSRKNPDRYIEIQAGSTVNGYVVLDGEGGDHPGTPRYSQAPNTIVRGLLYINGPASLHGLVNGAAFIDRSVFYTGDAYYENTLYNFLLIDNEELAYPVWMDAPYKKREIKWMSDNRTPVKKPE